MKLTVVYEDTNAVVARDGEQLYVGLGEPRKFEKIDSYSISYNGEPRLVSYVQENGTEVTVSETNQQLSLL